MAGKRRASRQRRRAQQEKEFMIDLERLPQELLHRVLHFCGRHTRRVCRHWLTVYGPLTGLHLSCPQDPARVGPRLAAITTLALAPAYLRLQCPEPRVNAAATFAALSQTFTHLQSLDVDTSFFAEDLFDLQAIARIGAHLTSLTLRYRFHVPVRRRFTNTLPALRCLTIIAEHPSIPQLALNAMSSLAHLRSLSFRFPSWFARASLSTDPDLSPALPALPTTLTHLDLSLVTLDLRPDGLQHLPPNLRHLSLKFAHKSWPPSHLPDTHVEAFISLLSGSQALTHLELCLRVPLVQTSFSHFSRLWNLRSLDLTCNTHSLPARQRLLEIGQAVPALPLKRLVLRNTGHLPWDAEVLQALLAATMLEQLQVIGGFPTSDALAGIQHLRQLPKLELVGSVDRHCSPSHVTLVADAILTLTQLTHLHLLPHHTELSHAVLAGISSLPSLRLLQTSAVSNADSLAGLAFVSSTLTRLQLDCSRCHGIATLRALRHLPHGVRYLALWGLRRLLNPSRATERVTRAVARLQEEAASSLLPLPGGVRVLALEAMAPEALPSDLYTRLQAAASAQDCVVVFRLPDDERYHGCNGYR